MLPKAARRRRPELSLSGSNFSEISGERGFCCSLEFSAPSRCTPESRVAPHDGLNPRAT